MKDKIIEILMKSGKLAQRQLMNLFINKKSDGSVVTNGDIAVSKFLEEELLKEFPDFEFYSEENYKNIKGKNVFVVDPIDGTESYLRNQQTWSILVAVIENGELTQGYVYQPRAETMFFGIKGEGAFKIRNSIRTQLISLPFGDKTGACSPKEYGETDFIQKQGILEIKKSYSAALKIMQVAEGKCDLYPNFRGKCSIWDLLAPKVILEESGGELEFSQGFKVDFAHPEVPFKFYARSQRFKKISFEA